MMVGLLSGCTSDTPCADMFLCAVWIPLSDPPHRRSCHHYNQKLDMSILVMDGPHPLHHHHHHTLTDILPSMKKHHDTFGLFGSFVSHHRPFALSAESDRLSAPSGVFFFSFSSVVTKSPDRTYIVCSEITCKHASVAKTSVSATESLTQDHLQPPILRAHIRFYSSSF